VNSGKGAARSGGRGQTRAELGASQGGGKPLFFAKESVMEEVVANAVLSKVAAVFGLIGQADDLLEGSWQRRDWGTFVRTWLATTVGVALVAFVLPFIMFMLPAMIYDLVALFMKTRTIPISFRETLAFGLRFGGMVGAFFLVSAIPIMLFKQFCGDWEPEAGA
jgi:hypothetical protein